MAREIGSLYYTLGIKGASDFTKTLEDARRAVSKLPQTYNHPVLGKIYDPDDLKRFGRHLDNIFSSSANVFEQKFLNKVTRQTNRLQEMLSQMSPTDKGYSGINNMLATLKAGGGRVSIEQIKAMQEGRTTFEENLRRATNQRSATERTLRASQDAGVIKKGSAYSNYLETGLADQIIEENIKNKFSMQSMKTEAEIAKAVDAYNASGKSAAGLLELQKQINIALHEESRVRNSILFAQERQRASDLNDKYAYINVRGKNYSEEEVDIGNSAYLSANTDMKKRLLASATAQTDKDIAEINNQLSKEDDLTTKTARDLLLKRDNLVLLRGEYAKLIPIVDAYFAKTATPPGRGPLIPGTGLHEDALKEIIREKGHLDVGDPKIQDITDKIVQEAHQSDVQNIVSGTRYGRFASLKKKSEEEAANASEKLNLHEQGIINLSEDDIAILRTHVREQGKLAEAAKVVLDVMKKTLKTEDDLRIARSRGDTKEAGRLEKQLKQDTEELKSSIRVVNDFNSSTHDASMASGRWGYQMQELGYGVQDFVQVLAGGGGLGPALRSASNNFSQFFAAAGGPTAAIASTAVALGVLGISVAMDHLGKSTENASGRIDDLIERLRIVGELNAEYAKSQGTVFGAAIGKDVSMFGSDTDIRESIKTSQRILDETINKEMQGKGGVLSVSERVARSAFSGITGLDINSFLGPSTTPEIMSAITRYIGVGGGADNELTGSSASQGVFDRILKQRFVGGAEPDKVEIPSGLMASLNTKERELVGQMLAAEDLEAALKAIEDASGEIPDEMKKLKNQLFQTREKLAEMERVQKDAVSAYAARRSFLQSDEQRMSLFSGEYSKGKRSEYTNEFIKSVEDYQKSSSPGMKKSAEKKAAEAIKGFKANAAGGQFEGPAAVISGFMNSAFSGELSQIASLQAVIDSPKSTAEMKKAAADAIATKRAAMAPEAIAGMRASISGYSPSMRVGETEDEFSARVKREISEAKAAIESFGMSLGMPRAEIDKLKGSIGLMGVSALQTAENLKRIKREETSRGIMSGKFSRIGDEDYAKKVNEIIDREKTAIAAADEEYDKGPDTRENYDRWMAKKQEAKNQASVELVNAEREYDRSTFASKTMLGGDIAKLIGGREGQKYQAELNHIERLRRIEEDKNLTADEKKAAADIEGRIFGAEMEQIDRKNVSFTDVGSQWKTIQNSLQGEPNKKILNHWNKYMGLVTGDGIRVKLSVGT